MKTKINYFTALLLSLLFFLTSCGLQDPDTFLDEVTDGIVLNVNTDLFNIPLAVQLTTTDQQLLGDRPVTITVLGKNADEIYATNGKKSLSASQGFVEVGVDRERIISKQNPLEVVMQFSIEGFLPVSKKVILQDSSFRLLNIPMVEKAALPEGSVANETVFVVEETGNPDTIIIETTEIDTTQDQTVVEIAPETILMNENSESVEGEISSQIVYFDGTEMEAQEAFPGGTVTSGAKDADGNDLGSVELAPVGFISFDLFLGDQEIKTFSQPVKITIPISNDAQNLDMGRPVSAGDEIPLWSLNETTGEWIEEGKGIVKAGNNGLIANFEITHLSWWSLHYVGSNACDGAEPITLNISSPFSSDCQAPIFFWELLDAATDMVIGTGQFLSVQDGSKPQLIDIPSDKSVYLEMFDQKDASCRNLLFTSATFTTSCNGMVDINLTSALTNYPTYVIEATMSGICQGSGSDLIVNPSFNVYYRPNNCIEWSFLGEAEDGFFCTANLAKGSTYDFRAFYGDETYDFDAVTIENQSIEYNGYTINITLGDTSADLEISDVVLDEEFCSLVE